jgi:hypothetical protein
VDHSARGSLMIMFPLARSMILEAAGLSITAPRRCPHPAGPARPSGPPRSEAES